MTAKTGTDTRGGPVSFSEGGHDRGQQREPAQPGQDEAPVDVDRVGRSGRLDGPVDRVEPGDALDPAGGQVDRHEPGGQEGERRGDELARADPGHDARLLGLAPARSVPNTVALVDVLVSGDPDERFDFFLDGLLAGLAAQPAQPDGAGRSGR
ncbi:MAG: hypothetical protein ACRD0A_17805 [Acidimicrobiales bacterium]